MSVGPNGDGWVPGADGWVWCGDGQQPKQAPPWPAPPWTGEESIMTLSLGDIGREMWESRERGFQAGVRAAIDAIARLDDKWSIATQNPATREFLQWCFAEARVAVWAAGSPDNR